MLAMDCQITKKTSSTGETQEDMNNVNCRRDMTNTVERGIKHHSINQLINKKTLAHSLCCLHYAVNFIHCSVFLVWKSV